MRYSIILPAFATAVLAQSSVVSHAVAYTFPHYALVFGQVASVEICSY